MESDRGKLFIGGISWDTTEETLRDYFSKYGQIADAVIMRDRNTGSARGFGFVEFANPNDADRPLQEKQHALAGRAVEVKKAVPRSEPQGFQNFGSAGSNSRGHQRTKKIFVGGLPVNLTENEFRTYFQQFGNITDVVVMYDSGTQRPRGFGFITFETEEAVEKVLQKNFHELNEKLVEVKRAVPREAAGGGGRGFGGAASAAARAENRGKGYVGYGPAGYVGYGPAGYVAPAAPPIDGVYGSGGFGYGSVVPTAAPTQFGGGYLNAPGWGGVRAPGFGGAQNMPPVYAYGDGGYSSGGYGGGGYYGGYGGTAADLAGGGGGVSFGGGNVSYGAAGRQSQRGADIRFRPYPDRTG